MNADSNQGCFHLYLKAKNSIFDYLMAMQGLRYIIALLFGIAGPVP